jgi:hypothetical protein
MGSQFVWYKIALENFVYTLLAESASEYKVEKMNTEELEALIQNISKQFSVQQFFYRAGVAITQMVQEAEEIGYDALNAAVYDAIDFENFIGLNDDDDKNEM